MKIKTYLFFILLIAVYTASCRNVQTGTSRPEKISDDSLLTLVEYRTFQYFWDGAEPNSGLARERFHVDGAYPENDKNIITSGGSGFGLMAILVGVERGGKRHIFAIQRSLSFSKKPTGFTVHGHTGLMVKQVKQNLSVLRTMAPISLKQPTSCKGCLL